MKRIRVNPTTENTCNYASFIYPVVTAATREHERRFAASFNGRNVAMVGDNRSIVRDRIAQGWLETAWDAIY